MSNTAMEFAACITAVENDPDTNPRLQIVNGAQAGQVASEWADPASPTWDVVDQRLASAGLTPAQVQVAWVKQALTGGGDFPAKAEALQADLEAIVQYLLLHYPNTRLAFVSSRTRSYLYWNGLSPEPIAFETGFSVKWLIEKQINGDPALNFDPANGPVRAPYLSWGPYLWADGTNPRGDGFTWQPEDLVADCTHPSPSGTDKIAALLMGFFEADVVSVAWFLESPAITPTAPTPSVTPPPTGTPGPSPTPQVLPEDIFLPVVGKNFPAPAASPGQNPGNLSLAQSPGDPARPGFIFFFFLAGGFGVVIAASRRIR